MLDRLALGQRTRDEQATEPEQGAADCSGLLRSAPMAEQEFQGGVFSGAIPGGRAGAKLAVRRDGIHARTDDGATFHVDFADCQLERGGASGKMWFCRAPDRSVTLFSEAPGFADALRAQASRQLEAAFARIGASHAEAHKQALRGWAALLLGTLLAVVGLYFGIRQLGRASLDLVPRAADEKIGALMDEQMTTEGPTVDDPRVKEAVEQIVTRLGKPGTEGFTFRVRVVESPTVNAFALPGGYVVVYTGLIRACETPEQLAGVLAHEMAHVTRRHGLRRIAQSVGVIALVQLFFGDVSGLAAVAVEVLRQGTLNSYGRDQEREADLDGVHRLHDAHVDPRALADFFALLHKREGDLPSAIAWLGTHPQLEARIDELRREAERVGTSRPEPFSLSWSEVQQRAKAD